MFIRTIKNRSELQTVFKSVGVDPAGAAIMSRKAFLHIIDIGEIDTRGANIFKQEALACGADLALPKDAAGYKVPRVRGVLMATEKQIGLIAGKLKGQPFGLKKVAVLLGEVLENFWKEKFLLKSPYGHELSLDKPVVMGVLNVTPDSFSDGGKFNSINSSVKRVGEMVEQGAKIIDIGGESTGPGSKDVSVMEEIKRVVPVIESVRKKFPDIFISIDTYKSEVVKAAYKAGADMVNDVTAGRGDPKMFSVVVKCKMPIVLMYSKDSSARTTRDKIQYEDVMRSVSSFLEGRVSEARAQGVEQVIVDPGMGAFVSGEPKYSFEILRRLSELKSFGLPILIGASRKSFLGGAVGTECRISNTEYREEKEGRVRNSQFGIRYSNRLEGSLACAVVAVMNGAKIIRAHDVGETVKVVVSSK